MSKVQLNRRDAFRASAALLPLAATSPAFSKKAGQQKSKVVVGMATTGFRDCTNRRLAQELAQRDVHTVQLFLTQSDSNYWKYNGRNDLSDMTPERCKEIADTYRTAGVSIHSIGVYTNLIHPDEAERKANLDYRKFVTLAATRTPNAPLILEYVGSKDYEQALGHLRGTMREVGVAEA